MDDPAYTEYTDISQLPQHTFNEISHFFRVYKSLEGKETVVNEVLGPEEAKEVIRDCIAAYKDNYC
jgi:inorganic pyrophosphatase